MSNLEYINLYSFNTENVINMSNMFNNCSHLKSIDLSSFNINRVQNMEWMFFWCADLISIDISSFDINKVNNKYEMFRLSSFDCSNDIHPERVKTIKVNKNSYEEIKSQINSRLAKIIVV